MKKILAMLLSVAIIATIAIGGSIAYLQDTDKTVNTMEMGNVDIEQIEQERDANEELVAFQNGQKLYPAHYTPVGASDDLTDSSEPAEKDTDGFYTGIAGAMDKIVHVENVGKSEAYIRTWFAFEADDDGTLKYIHPNWNTNPAKGGIAAVEYNDGKAIEIGADKNKYVVYSVTYPEAIQPGAATANSLLEVFMDKAATNEYVAQFGDTYEILVLSQGVQVENFSSAEEALNAAFGSAAPWNTSTPVAVPTFIKTAEELKTALNSIDSLGANKTLNIVLGADISLKDYDWDLSNIVIEHGKTVVIDGNGYTISDLNKSYGDNGGLLPYVYMDGGYFTVKNLNLKNFTIKGANSTTSNGEAGSAGGALIGYFNNWCNEETKFENVNVVGASIEGFKYLGGLIGYQTIYNDNHVGLTLSECSVTGSTLNSTFTEGVSFKGHVGGLVGYFQRGAMTNNTVKDTVITGSTTANRAGAMIGTAQPGVVIGTGKVTNVKINGVAVDSSNRTIVGSVDNRSDKSDSVTVDAGTGDNTLISNNTEFTNAVAHGNGKTVTLTAGTYEFNDPNCVWDDVTIVGNPGVVIKASRQNFHNVKFKGVTFEAGDGNGTNWLDPTGEEVLFENCTFNANAADKFAYHGDMTKAKELIFKNCVFNNGVVACGPKETEDSVVTFENCTFNFASVNAYGNIRSYCNTEIKNCTFNLNGAKQYVSENVTVTVTGGNYATKVVRAGTQYDKGTVSYT